MTEIKLNEFIKLLQPGDIGLTRNPHGLGKLIRFGQDLEGDPSRYGHAFIVAKKPGKEFVANGDLYESLTTIGRTNIKSYLNTEVCIMRHRQMTPERFFLGREELLDNIGQTYPFHRLALHGIDLGLTYLFRGLSFRCLTIPKFVSKTNIDWPVCSEYAAQFIMSAELEFGHPIQFIDKDSWSGINPDHIDDARQYNLNLWQTIVIAQLIT